MKPDLIAEMRQVHNTVKYLALFFLLSAMDSFAKEQASKGSFYMQQVYPQAVLKNPRIHVAIKNYAAAVLGQGIAKERLGPRVMFNSEAGMNVSQGDNQLERRFTRAGFSLFQPLFTWARIYDHRIEKLNVELTEWQKKMREEQFLVLYGESLLRISERKTRYYFAQEKLLLRVKYLEKARAHLASTFAQEHPGETEKPEDDSLILTLMGEVSFQERELYRRRSELQNEVNMFRTLVLNEAPYKFDNSQFDPLKPSSLSNENVDLSHYDPSQLKKNSLPKYILVHPFIERALVYTDPAESFRIAEQLNLSLAVSRLAIRLAAEEVKKGRSVFWPEINFVANTQLENNNSRFRNPSFAHSNFENNSFFGVVLSFDLWGTGKRKALAQQRAYLERSQLEYAIVLRQLETDVYELHTEIETLKWVIQSSLKSYKSTRAGIERFLSPQFQIKSETSILDNRELINQHFQFAEELALQQHKFLLSILKLLTLRHQITPESMARIEAAYFVDCSSYDSFLRLREITRR